MNYNYMLVHILAACGLQDNGKCAFISKPFPFNMLHLVRAIRRIPANNITKAMHIPVAVDIIYIPQTPDERPHI